MIKCKSKGLIIDEKGYVYPCCFVNTNKDSSPYINSLEKNWNSLHHYSLENILSHEAFRDHFNTKGWCSGKPDFICKKCCSSAD